MKFYVTLDGNKVPGNGYYVEVEAPCEDTCIQKLNLRGITNWSTLYRTITYVRRQKLKLWRTL